MDSNENSGGEIIDRVNSLSIDPQDDGAKDSESKDSEPQSVVKRVCFSLKDEADDDCEDEGISEREEVEDDLATLEEAKPRLVPEDLVVATTSTNGNLSDIIEKEEEVTSPAGSGIDELLESLGPDCKNLKHIFILSSAGKPVYSRYGSEEKLVTLFGVMQALVSVMQDEQDTLHGIECGDTCIGFLSEGPIILVGVSHSGDSLDHLRKKLSYMHSQVVSVLTLTRLTRIFEERHNYDLRRLLSGSERIIDHLLTFTETRPEFLFDSISCLYMPQSARDAVSNAIVSSCSKIKNLVFAVLIGNEKIISIVSLKKYKLEPCDIHLICNLIGCSESFKTAESWTPICLPKFDPSGYLHAHVSYLNECPACLLLLTVEKDSFFELSEAKNKIEQKMIQNQSMIILKTALSQNFTPSIKSMDLPLVRHLVYKSCVNSQLVCTEVTEPYETQEKWCQLLVKYERLYRMMMDPVEPLKVLYQQLTEEVMLGWITNKFQLYVVFEPLLQKSDCINTVDKILHWIQKEEEKLFMMSYFYFN